MLPLALAGGGLLGGMSLLGGNGRKGAKYIEPESFPGAKEKRKKLFEAAEPGALGRLGLAGEGYQGPLVAALSEFEETGLEGLRDYLGQPLPTEGELYTSAVDEILKTLSAEGDEEYKQAYKTKMMRELEEGMDLLASKTSARDKYFGGGRIETSGEMIEDYLAELAVIQAEVDERAKGRKMQAIQDALGFTQYAEEAPVQRIGVSQQYGALPRLIKQAEMDADYQEWLRALSDLGISLDTATGLATYQPGGTMVTGGGGGGLMQNLTQTLGIMGSLKNLMA